MYKVTILFKHTNLNLPVRATKSIFKQLSDKIIQNKIISIVIYKLKCITCNNSYVGQTGSSLEKRHKELIRYIKTNDSLSAYVIHILNNKREYGNIEQTVEPLKPCNKGVSEY